MHIRDPLAPIGEMDEPELLFRRTTHTRHWSQVLQVEPPSHPQGLTISFLHFLSCVSQTTPLGLEFLRLDDLTHSVLYISVLHVFRFSCFGVSEGLVV